MQGKRTPEKEEKYKQIQSRWDDTYCALCDPEVINTSLVLGGKHASLIRNKYPYELITFNGHDWVKVIPGSHMMIIPNHHTNSIEGLTWAESILLMHKYAITSPKGATIHTFCRPSGDSERTIPHHCHTHIFSTYSPYK